MTLKSGRLRSGLRNVSSVSAIPDSVTNHWPTDEGSGTTLADSVGSQDITITGATWVSGDGNGGAHLDYDGTDDYSRNTDDTYWETNTFSWMQWINIDTNSLDDRVVSTHPNGFKGDAWSFRLTGSEIEFFYHGSSSNTTIQTTGSSTSVWTFIAAVTDGVDATVYWAEVGDSTLTTAGTESVDSSFGRAAENLTLAAIDDGSGGAALHYDGQQDDPYYAKGSKLAESDVAGVFDSTKGNYS